MHKSAPSSNEYYSDFERKELSFYQNIKLKKKAFTIFSSFFKILQLVHARNKPIQQPFAQFLVESNSHQYESRE